MWYHARSWVSIHVVRAAIIAHVPNTSTTTIDKNMLTKLVPGMTMHQSEYFINGALEQSKAEEDGVQSISDAMQMIGDISFKVKKMLVQVEALTLELFAE